MTFVDELLSEFEFEINGDKTFIIKDGKVLEDSLANKIDFKKFIGERAGERWDFKEGESRKGTGNNNDDNPDGGIGGKAKYSGPKLTSEDDYMKAMKEAKTPEEKSAITMEWNNNPANIL